MARFNMEWFRKQEELKKQKEAEQAKLEGKTKEKDDDEFNPCITPTESKMQTSAKSSYFKFHKNKNAKDNPHYFLVEELLVPRASNADTQRLN